MNVELTVQDKSGKIYVYQTFEDKEFFIDAVEKTYARRVRFGTLSDKDKIISLFSKGATIQQADFDNLARALRHYDEVYLCNELCEAIEEIPSEIVLLTMGNIEKPVDLSCYEI